MPSGSGRQQNIVKSVYTAAAVQAGISPAFRFASIFFFFALCFLRATFFALFISPLYTFFAFSFAGTGIPGRIFRMSGHRSFQPQAGKRRRATPRISGDRRYTRSTFLSWNMTNRCTDNSSYFVPDYSPYATSL